MDYLHGITRLEQALELGDNKIKNKVNIKIHNFHSIIFLFLEKFLLILVWLE